MIKGLAETPDVAARRVFQDFFSKCLGAAVKTAVVLMETKIRHVFLREACSIRTTSDKNTARRNISPREIHLGADIFEMGGKDNIAD